MRVDVAIVGGGLAGSVAALALARRGISVMVLETDAPRRGVGENLAAEALPVLSQLGLSHVLRDAVALPSHALLSVWGSNDVAVRPAVANPYGTAWHLDRERFDHEIQREAVQAGAVWIDSVERASPPLRSGDYWNQDVKTANVTVTYAARYLIDASGRGAWLGNRLGARRRFDDHLHAAVFSFAEPIQPYALVEAQPEGWWYSAPTPDNRAMAIYLSDAALLSRRRGAERKTWWKTLVPGAETARRFSTSPTSERIVPAFSALARFDAADAWLAIGDAAIAVDPLCGRGLLQALTSATAGARAIAEALRGRSGAAREYAAAVHHDYARYLVARRAAYAQERRWPESTFWRARRGLPGPASGE